MEIMMEMVVAGVCDVRVASYPSLYYLHGVPEKYFPEISGLRLL